jgi:hypothetical protein
MAGKESFGKVASEVAPALVRQIGQEPRGRGQPPIDPSAYQAEIVTRLCTGESLSMICVDAAMPSLRTVNQWLATDPEFKDAVNGARAIGINTLMDAAYSIASGWAHSTGSIERDKLLCSVIKWIVAKRDPDNAPSIHLHGGTGIHVVIAPDHGDW